MKESTALLIRIFRHIHEFDIKNGMTRKQRCTLEKWYRGLNSIRHRELTIEFYKGYVK